jgi:hypothetical protein
MNNDPDSDVSHDESHDSDIQDIHGLVFLTSPKRWPKAGDSLFSSGDDPLSNACLHFAHNPWDLYAAGYLKAADCLAYLVIETGRGLDTWLYPIVFLYRHYLELRLKELIVQGSALIEVPPNLKLNHDLGELWKSVRKILVTVWSNESTAELDAVEKCIAELCEVDKKSEGFRYPFRKDGKPSLPELNHLNIRNFREVMAAIARFLDACSAGISDYLDNLRDSMRDSAFQ